MTWGGIVLYLIGGVVSHGLAKGTLYKSLHGRSWSLAEKNLLWFETVLSWGGVVGTLLVIPFLSNCSFGFRFRIPKKHTRGGAACLS